MTREEYYETFIKVQIKNNDHLHIFLKATLEEGAAWSADDCRWFEAMYTAESSPSYKTDITKEDILEVPKKLKKTKPPKKTHKLTGYEG